MPCAPLLSATPPIVAKTAAIVAFNSASSDEASVIIPSPLKRVLAKIAAMSAVSAKEIIVPSLPKFSRIRFAEEYNFLPLASSVLI